MIRAVFFDAVGTLIEPDPPAAEVYHATALRHGSCLTLDEVARRFRSAFRREEAIDRASGWRTDEAREERRWRDIVATVLDDVRDPEGCFRELWRHFADPGAWRAFGESLCVIEDLGNRGYVLGVASNFDGRLRGVLAGLGGFGPLRYLVISSEVGWRKPSPAYFARLVETAGIPPEDILLVGDDPVSDDAGARAAGLHSYLLGESGCTIDSLRDRLR